MILCSREDRLTVGEWDAPLSFFMEVGETAFRITEERLTDVLKPLVEQEGFEWVGCRVTRRGDLQVRLFVDLPQGGINLDQVEQVSRMVDPLVEDMAGGDEGDRYYLEVGSPGLERPLFTLEHYCRFAGKLMRARMKGGFEGPRTFEGHIMTVEADKVRVSTAAGEVSFSPDQVYEARLVYREQKGQKKTFKKGGAR